MDLLRIWIKTYWVPLRNVLVLVAAVAIFAAGWSVKGWRDAAADAAQERGVQLAVDAFHKHEQAVGALLENKLGKLRANQTIVEKQLETITERPVYRADCLDADGLRALEAARTGQPAASEPARTVP